MKESLAGIGFFLIFAGIALVVFNLITSKSSNTKFAIGGFVGPFPFGFANSSTMLWVVLGLSALFIILNFVLRP